MWNYNLVVLLQRTGVWYLWTGLWPSHCDTMDGIKPWVKKEGLEARLCHLPYVHVGRANRALQVQIALDSPGSWVQLLTACHSPRLKTQSKINHEAVRDCPAGYTGPLLLRGWVSFLICPAPALVRTFPLVFSRGELIWGVGEPHMQNPYLFLYLTVSPPQPRPHLINFQYILELLPKIHCRQILKAFYPESHSSSVICVSERAWEDLDVNHSPLTLNKMLSLQIILLSFLFSGSTRSSLWQ